MRVLRRIFVLLVLTMALGLGALAVLRPVPKPPALPPLTGTVDHILVEKSARKLTVFRDGAPLREYRVALGFFPAGDKLREGDGRTPEGHFRINRRNPQSAFHLSLGIDYPQREHIVRAAAGGYSPGGDIFIHGQPNALKGKATIRHDWTAGCIALSDAEVEEIWRVTPDGTTVEIRP